MWGGRGVHPMVVQMGISFADMRCDDGAPIGVLYGHLLQRASSVMMWGGI